MKKIVCLSLFCFVFALQGKITNHGHIKICNKTRENVDVTIHYDEDSKNSSITLQGKKPKKKPSCIKQGWIHKKHKLRYFTVEYNKNEYFKKSGLYAEVSITKNGLFAVGKVDINPYKSISLIKHQIDSTAHIKAGREVMNFNITDVGFNPQGSFIASCNGIVTDEKKDSFSGRCTMGSIDPNYRYNFQIKGLSILNKGLSDNTIPQNIDFKNVYKFMSFQKIHSDFGDWVAVYPEGYGNKLPPGSYTKSCTMAYFNHKKGILYAACPQNWKYLKGRMGDHLIWEWFTIWGPINPTITYKISSLQTQQCQGDIKNKGGSLYCKKGTNINP